MNKILVTARKAKRVSEEDVATLLKITLPDYRALESHQKNVTPAQARLLADYFAVPAWYFLDLSKPLDIAERIALLKKQHEIIGKPEYQVVPPGASVALATTIIELMIAKEELGRSLSRELELAEDVAAITLMNEHLVSLLKTQSSPRKQS